MSENFIKSLTQYFTKSKAEVADAVPEGACPNCWGHYEYGDQVRTIIHDRQIDVENNRQVRAFVEDFVVQHVDGAHLREENNKVTCPSCGLDKSTHSHA
jgi:hypothetical protein